MADKNKYYLKLLFFVLALAVYFRFANYFSRLNFSIDQGRDALIGLESLQKSKAPLLGPPSSSWGFNFGPLYYYFVIFFTAIIPSIYAPWIGFTVLSLMSVVLAYKIGEFARSREFGLLFALVTTISFGEIANSTNLLNTALVSNAVFLSFFAVAAYYKLQKNYFLILLGFAVSVAINAHLQAAPIVGLLLSPLLLHHGKKIVRKVVSLLYPLVGFTFGMLPLIGFEAQHNLAWTKSLIDYATFGQYRFYTPVRWLTDITIFWPNRFGEVLWGNSFLGIYVTVLVGLTLAFAIWKRKIDKISILVLFIFILEIFSLRNYKGPRSSEYLIFTNFFVIYLFSFAVSLVSLFKKQAIFTSVFFIIAISGLWSYGRVYSTSTHSKATISMFKFVKNNIGKPVNLFILSDSYENAYSLQYLLQRSNLISEAGARVALCDNGDAFSKGFERCPKSHRLFSTGRFVLFEYQKYFADEFKTFNPATISAEILYKRTYNNYERVKY